MKSTPFQILARIRKAHGGPGAIVTPKDFLDLAGRAAVDQALGRLARAGAIARVARGIYHMPRVNRRLGLAIPPDPDEVAAAIARQTGSAVAPSGAVAANRFGVTTQIAANLVYVTTGRTRVVRVGRQVLRFKRVARRRLPDAGAAVQGALQVLHMVGPRPDEATIAALRRHLTPRERRSLVEHARYDAAWVAESARRAAAPNRRGAAYGRG